MTRWLALTLLGGVATPALAQERNYCPERPGLATPACVVDRGHVSIETGVIDWTLDRQPDTRTDTILIGDTLARFGVSDRVEARVGWTPYGHERTRDRLTGAVEREDAVGDVTLGIKANLAHPDGSGLAVAVLPFVTVPVGSGPIGGGAAGGGLLIPVTFELSDAVTLEATPEVDAIANEDRSGRHLQYSLVGGASYAITDALNLTAEAQAIQDDDPDQAGTQLLGALSLAWQPGDDWQFDISQIVGFNRAAPDVELAAGISRRF